MMLCLCSLVDDDGEDDSEAEGGAAADADADADADDTDTDDDEGNVIQNGDRVKHWRVKTSHLDAKVRTLGSAAYELPAGLCVCVCV